MLNIWKCFGALVETGGRGVVAAGLRPDVEPDFQPGEWGAWRRKGH
jgi:hypothetical protein